MVQNYQAIIISGENIDTITKPLLLAIEIVIIY